MKITHYFLTVVRSSFRSWYESIRRWRWL